MVDDGYFGQGGYRIRLEWGARGAAQCAGEIAVVVDVLSFSTSVCVAVERGMGVYPFPWRDGRAAEFAQDRDAFLAVGRLEAHHLDGPVPPTLSPAGLLCCEPERRIVLPSPNGSTISEALKISGSQVLIGCFRNRRAVADSLHSELANTQRAVTLVAAGERWRNDDTLRPALEDHLGAGSILAALQDLGFGAEMSPEAQVAASAYREAADRLGVLLRGCVSGRELIEQGFGRDVEVAAAVDHSSTVPVLQAEGFFSA